MELHYMPEVLSHGSLRAPIYRDYEQPWNKDYFNYGKSTSHRAVQGQYRASNQSQKVQTNHKDHCHLCKTNKRRVLGNYIKKSRTNSYNDIYEEKEEEMINEIDEDEVIHSADDRKKT